MDPRLPKRIFILLIAVVISGILHVIFYEKNTLIGYRMTHDFPQLWCMRLRNKFSNITSAKTFNIKSFTKDLSELMSCPQVSNKAQKELNRIRLRSCCNATGILYLTKQNTAEDEKIPYETASKLTYKMTASLHNMLPEDFPWSGRGLGRCAVVGSGGILQNSSCGGEIDSADYVIRFNMAPINDSDVGLKTDLITINPTQLIAGDMRNNPDALVQRVSVYGNASLIMPAFSYQFGTGPSINTLKTLRPIRPQQRVVFFSSYYLKTLDNFWKRRGLKETRLSTGFMLINVALELCDQVHIYGFWPFDINLQQQPVPHHYYDKRGPNPGMHSMPKEFLYLLQLHSQGVLTLHLQPCL